MEGRRETHPREVASERVRWLTDLPNSPISEKVWTQAATSTSGPSPARDCERHDVLQSGEHTFTGNLSSNSLSYQLAIGWMANPSAGKKKLKVEFGGEEQNLPRGKQRGYNISKIELSAYFILS